MKIEVGGFDVYKQGCGRDDDDLIFHIISYHILYESGGRVCCVQAGGQGGLGQLLPHHRRLNCRHLWT